MGRDVFKDKNYYFGGAIFLLITLGWLVRNKIRFSGSSERAALSYTPTNLSMDLLIMFILKFPYLIILVAVCLLFWVHEIKQTLSKIKKEDYNALWTFTIGYFLVIWVITALMGGTEIHNRDIVFRPNHIRYITPIYVSILWLVIKDHEWTHQGEEVPYFSREMVQEIRNWLSHIFREKKPLLYMFMVASIGVIVLIEIEFFIGLVLLFAAPTFAISSVRKKLAIMLLVFSIVGVNASTIINEYPYIAGGKDLQGMLNEGDTVMIDGEWSIPEKYDLYPYLAESNVKKRPAYEED